MSTYYAMLTATGLAEMASAQANGVPIVIAQFAVGDANGVSYSPTGNETGLEHQVWAGNVNKVYVHPNNANWVVVEAIIPATSGGFSIREAGLYDSNGNFIAIASYPLVTLPGPGSGSSADFYIRMILELSNTATVQQTIDSSLIMATEQYVDIHDLRPVKAASTGPIDIVTGGAQTIDGVVLAVGDRVLVKDQADATTNGIYLVQAATWIRAYDADESLEVLANMVVVVDQGTVNDDSIWMLATNSPITLGTSSLNFIRVFGGTGVAPGVYKSVTVDAEGRVTAGSNPTTLGGFGITDAVPASEVVSAPAPGKLLLLDNNAKLPTSIEGDAATVGGAAPGTGPNEILKLDANGEVPLANIPTPLTGKDADTVDGYHGTAFEQSADILVEDLPLAVLSLVGPAYNVPAWTVWNIASYLPLGTRYAIVNVEIGIVTGSNDDTYELHIRPSGSSSPGYIAGGNYLACVDARQGIYPVGADRNLEYYIRTSTGGQLEGTVSLKLAGYIK